MSAATRAYGATAWQTRWPGTTAHFPTWRTTDAVPATKPEQADLPAVRLIDAARLVSLLLLVSVCWPLTVRGALDILGALRLPGLG